MPEPAGQLPSKAARVLAAAGELVLSRGSRGVTIAEVARRAHIGKGTVYLYWNTKEDLLLDLVCRDFLAFAEEVIAAVTDDPDLARPSRLSVSMLTTAAAHPYVNALGGRDEELLGVLADDPRSATLLGTLGPDAVMRRVLPIWRDHDLARTDWLVEEQALALGSLIAGFKLTIRLGPTPGVDDPGRVLAAAVTALLGPERATPEQVAAAAADGILHLREQSAVALSLLSQPVSSSQA